MSFCIKCGTKMEGRFCPTCGYDSEKPAGAATELEPTAKSVAPELPSPKTKETLEELYGLRAGLSYISAKRDEYEEKVEGVVGARVKRLEGNINHGWGRIVDKEKELGKEEANVRLSIRGDQLEAKKKKHAKLKLSLGKLEKSYDRLTTAREFVCPETKKNLIILGIVSGILGLCAGAVVGILAIPGMWVGKVIAGILCGAVCGGILFLILGFILMGIDKALELIMSVIERIIKKKDKLREKIEADISIAEIGLSAPRKIERIKKDIASIKTAISSDEKSLTAARAELKKKNDEYSVAAKTFFSSLVKGYAKTLDTRDWENLDLVIYYLETGRADTVKEALQQVDRQRQNDKLVESLGIATEQICMTISNGFRQMSNVMMNCTRIMASGLEDVRREQASLAGKMEHFSGVTEAALSRALSEKADTSSRQMVEDVHFMRELAEDVERRRRFGTL